MKTKITSLTDALAFILQGLYFTETKLQEEFSSCCGEVSSNRIQHEIDNYISSAADKRVKLERIFNYLMKEPLIRSNPVVNELLNEAHKMLAGTTSAHLKDVLTIGCIQNINAYKLSNYRLAYMLTVELELDTATDLLQQILEWEIETSKILATLSIEEFNKAQWSMA